MGAASNYYINRNAAEFAAMQMSVACSLLKASEETAFRRQKSSRRHRRSPAQQRKWPNFKVNSSG